MRKPSNDSVRLGRVVAFTAAYGLNATCIGIWQSFTWTWHNCGSVRCLGTQFGKARHKIVWIMFSPGEVRIGYIRRALWDRSSTDAVSVIELFVFSVRIVCLDVCGAAGFASCRIFCSTDCVLLAGFGLSFRRVSECWTMATDGAALVENRAGITFGVELYIPWDAPEAVVDIQSEGVVPLRSIPDIIGLAGRRSDAGESRILQGRDICSVRVLVPVY